MQDELARMLLQFAGEEQHVVQLTAKEEASFEESLAQADRGKFATGEQVRAIWASMASEAAPYLCAAAECDGVTACPRAGA